MTWLGKEMCHVAMFQGHKSTQSFRKKWKALCQRWPFASQKVASRIMSFQAKEEVASMSMEECGSQFQVAEKKEPSSGFE